MNPSSTRTSTTPKRPDAQARAGHGRPRGQFTYQPPGSGTESRQLVSLAAAAAYVDVSTRTLRRYISQGRLTGYRVGPRLVKVELQELEMLARRIPTLGS